MMSQTLYSVWNRLQKSHMQKAWVQAAFSPDCIPNSTTMNPCILYIPAHQHVILVTSSSILPVIPHHQCRSRPVLQHHPTTGLHCSSCNHTMWHYLVPLERWDKCTYLTLITADHVSIANFTCIHGQVQQSTIVVSLAPLYPSWNNCHGM